MKTWDFVVKVFQDVAEEHVNHTKVTYSDIGMMIMIEFYGKIIDTVHYKNKVFIPGMKIYIGKDKICEEINSYRHHKIFEMITMVGYNDIDEVLKYKGDYVRFEDWTCS